jgi:hypothetical protein
MIHGQTDTLPAKKWGVSVKGNFNVTANYYNAFAGGIRTSPFSRSIGGTLSAKVGNVDIPINLVFRDHSISLSRYFAYYGFSPQWGKTKLHFGYRNVQFSQYSLGGATFWGAAIETRLSFLRLGGMWGSFQNPLATRDSLVYGTIILPTFDRKGYSIKLGFGNDRNFFDFVVLKVKDKYNPNSVNPEIIFSPKDNLVVGIVSNLNLGKRVSFRIDGAVSGLTNDLSNDAIIIEDQLIQNLRNLLVVNTTTSLFYAGESELRFNLGSFNTSLQYRRISPYYQSLGINYLTPDTEDYTVGLQGAFWKRKIRINARVGVQRNNLFNHKLTTSNRIISSTSLSYRGKGPFRLNVQYNNYDISMQPTIQEINDVYQLARVMNQFRVSPAYQIKKKDMHHNISMSLMLQTFTTNLMDARTETQNTFVQCMYALSYMPLKISGSVGLDYNQNQDLRFIRDRYGVNFSISRPFLKNKLNASAYASVFSDRVNKQSDGTASRFGLNGSYRVSKSHLFSLSCNYVNRNSIVFGKNSDIMARTSYMLNF